MKILKIILITLLVVVVIVIGGLVVFLKTFEIDRIKPRLLAETSHLLGRRLYFQDMNLGFSLKEGVSLQFKGLTVADDPAFQAGDFLKADELSMTLDLIALLTKRQIVILGLHIQSPQMIIMRNSKGKINLESLGKPSLEKASFSGSDIFFIVRSLWGSPVAWAESDLPSVPSGPFFVKTVTLKDGTLLYKDQSFPQELSLQTTKIDLKVESFSLSKPFSFSATGAFLGDQKNWELNGQAQIHPHNGRFQLSNTKITMDLSLVSLEKTRASFPMVPGNLWPSVLEGKLKATIKTLETAPKGFSALLGDADLAEGKLYFKDIVPGVLLQASHIGLKVEGFSLTSPSRFALQAGLFSDHPNVSLEGTIQWNAQTGDLRLNDTGLAIDFSLISLSQLQSSILALKDRASLENLQGKFQARIKEAKITPAGLSSLMAEGELKEGMLKIRELLLPIAIQSRFQMTESQIHKEVSCSLGQGRLSAQANIKDYLAQQDLDVQVDLKDLNLKEVLDQAKQPVKLEGILSGQFQLAGELRRPDFSSGVGVPISHEVRTSGDLKPEALITAVTGEGTLTMEEGMLKDFNILRIVLDKISIIPDLVEKIEAALPERYKELLTQKDTPLKKVNFQTKIHEGALVIQSAHIEADGFLLQGQGRVGFDQRFSLNGSFSILEDLASSMIGIVPELEYLLDEDKRILIPGLKAAGKIPKLEDFSIDLEYLAQRLLINKGRSELEKALDKVFDREKGSSAPSGDSSPPPSEEKRSEQELIEGILDSIFK